MLGLIKKDLLIAAGNIKILAIIFVVFIFMSLEGNNNFSFIPAFISITIMMSTFSYDEYNKSDAYITSLPNGKLNAVKAKYLGALIVVIISTLITLIMSFIIGCIKNTINIEETVSITLGSVAGVIIIESIMYPLIYKFGMEKGRIGLFVGTFTFIALFFLISKLDIKLKIPNNIITFLDKYYLIIIPIIIIIILTISYKISKRIYLKKEF